MLAPQAAEGPGPAARRPAIVDEHASPEKSPGEDDADAPDARPPSPLALVPSKRRRISTSPAARDTAEQWFQHANENPHPAPGSTLADCK